MSVFSIANKIKSRWIEFFSDHCDACGSVRSELEPDYNMCSVCGNEMCSGCVCADCGDICTDCCPTMGYSDDLGQGGVAYG
jgi:hypothetical protein